MLGLLGNKVKTRAGSVVASVVARPFFPQNLATESILIIRSGIAIGVLHIGTILGDFKTVRGGTQTHDGTSPVQIVHEMLHLILGPVLETGEDHHEIGLRQFLDARHVVGPRLYFAFGVYTEHHGALEAMVLGKNAGKGR